MRNVEKQKKNNNLQIMRSAAMKWKTAKKMKNNRNSQMETELSV